jgi:nitrite reductase/ring-hydroxylating ferredoxin subunit
MATGFSRREFVCGGCAVVASACAPQGNPLPADSDSGNPWANTTPITTDPNQVTGYPCDQNVSGGTLELPLSQYPDLEEVGGWYAVGSGAGEIIVAHAVEGCYVAIERACAHEGVAIDYQPSRGQFVCPKHGAIYDWQGDKVAGPQPNGLPVYPCGRVGNSIFVTV